VTNTVLYGYVIGWVITSIGLALTTRHLSRPASTLFATGAVWPLLVLGAAQFAAVALVAEVARNSEPGPKAIDDELHALLTEWAVSDAGAHDRRLPVVTGRVGAHESSVDTCRPTVSG